MAPHRTSPVRPSRPVPRTKPTAQLVLQFCRDFTQGNLEPFYRSAPPPPVVPGLSLAPFYSAKIFLILPRNINSKQQNYDCRTIYAEYIFL